MLWQRLLICCVSFSTFIAETLSVDWNFFKVYRLARLSIAQSSNTSPNRPQRRWSQDTPVSTIVSGGLKSYPITEVLDAKNPADTCEKLRYYLVKRQRKICRRHPSLIISILEGYAMAWTECQRQFVHSRWDCRGHRDRNVFELMHNKGTKEAAFLQALTSAGVSHKVTKACSKGKHAKCGCDHSVYDYPKSGDVEYKWSGCSDHVHFGTAFSKKFIDAYERRTRKRNPELAQTKLHNNRVGRQIILDMTKVRCKCHGVSGSCEMKTCWRSLPQFEEVGDEVEKSFHRAIRIRFIDNQLIPFDIKQRGVTGVDLVYKDLSPDFCHPDDEFGSVGTQGRLCNKTFGTPNNCIDLCCQRGYNTRVEVVQKDCRCKFVWCCEVKCQLCQMPVEVSKCL